MAREGSVTRETCNSWPFRIRLTTDYLRWDSLKILPSKEFEEHILGNMNEASHYDLEAWIPVELSIHDADTHETYSVKLAKKEAFWFKPTPFLDEKQRKKKPFYPYSTIMDQSPCYDWKEARKEFSYSIEPFQHIVKKRNLNYDQEIGFRWSESEAVQKLEFSVLHVPRLDLHSLRI